MRHAFLAIGLVISFSPDVFAQDTGGEQALDFQDEEARGLFAAGRSAYADGRFDDALGHFQHAYELSERPILLFNIASCLDRLRRDAEALQMFERYLEAVPDAPNRSEVEGRIRVLAQSAPAEAGPTGPGPGGGEAPETEPGDAGRIWTWVSLAATAALGGAAVATWLAGDGEEQSLRDSCADRAPSGCTDDEVATLQTLDTLTNAFLLAAVGAGALTIVLFAVEGGDGGGEVVVRMAPTGAQLSGRF